jgi:hypothetical protein
MTPMTDETTIERWLDERWFGQATCPAGHEDWVVAPNLSFMPGFATTESGPKIMHERGFTFVVLTCGQCGYVAFLDTRTVGQGVPG